MADIIVPFGTFVQGTSSPTDFYDQLVNNNQIQNTSQACLVDTTPPTFAGVASVDIESRGQIRTSWLAATDATLPIRYEVYIKASTSVGLFNTINITAITPNLQYDIFTLPDGSLLQNGTSYFVGIRAIDGVSNRDSNLVSLSVIATGISSNADFYEAQASWSTDTANQLAVTAWANKNSSRAVAPNDVMGAASYQLYDAAGSAVVGVSGSVGSPNAQGLYIFPAVSGFDEPVYTHYQLRVTVSVDGEDRVNFIPIHELSQAYNMDGVADINYSGQLVGSFWVRDLTGIITNNLGTGSWDLFTSSGVDTGIGGTGITATADGFFVVPPFTFPGPLDTTQTYVVRAAVSVAGQAITAHIPVAGDPMTFDPRAIFSINGANQLQATLWAVRNEEMAPAATLGAASYQVYDATGAAVAGLSESGLVADGNGYYHITPVSAALLSDLTHYKVKVTIIIQGQAHTSTHGFTLLGN